MVVNLKKKWMVHKIADEQNRPLSWEPLCIFLLKVFSVCRFGRRPWQRAQQGKQSFVYFHLWF